MIRRVRLMAALGAFLLGCAVLVVVGCAGLSSEGPKDEQGRTEVTEGQARSPEATASEEARCARTRTIEPPHSVSAVTNDVPGCPNGGPLSGTDGRETLNGKDGDDKIRGLGAADVLRRGSDSDVIYGGPGTDILEAADGDDVLYGGTNDDQMWGGGGADVIYGGDGNDHVVSGLPAIGDGGSLGDGQHDKLYCGAGRDHYAADKLDSVSSSCEVKYRPVIPS